MRCKEAEFWISVRIDGEEVPAAKGVPLDRHLLDCPSCRGLLSREMQRSAILERALDRPAGNGALLSARILAQAAADGGGRPRPWWGGVWLPASVLVPLAASLVMLVLGWAWWWGAPPAETPRRDPGYALLEQDSLNRDVYSTETGDPVLRDTMRKRWTFSPVGAFPPRSPRGDAAQPSGGAPALKEDKSGEVILDVERVDTRYLRFAGLEYR